MRAIEARTERTKEGGEGRPWRLLFPLLLFLGFCVLRRVDYSLVSRHRAWEGTREGGREIYIYIATEAAVFSQPKLRPKKDVRERERNGSDRWLKERK